MAHPAPNAFDTSQFTRITTFDGARDAAAPEERLREVRRRAARFRDEVLASGQVRYYRSFGLVRAPYPTRYAFTSVYAMNPLVTPILHILNRLFVVQYESAAGVKTLLFSPTDVERNRETPFFKRLAASVGLLGDVGQRAFAPMLADVQSCLAQTGIRPEQVDYISYDHLHTQDVRRWLGADGAPGYFPNAKLLVMRQEWESAQALLPPQRDWYCPNGIAGIDPARVVLLDGDVLLGNGVALVRTPGHTEGNHSLVAHTPAGLLVSSENGVGPDAYAPLKSRITAIRDYAKTTGMEVILNGNTQEGGLDQYISMIQEREIAGPSHVNPDFYNVVSSSEFTAYTLFPGMTPTFNYGDLEFGAPQRLAR
ncbi:MAG: hypothetical protein HY271_08925 [Deltaproteobacteria bacterium]|nr:hypothetical protein [Deltaproteobacteria bacterium]